jgi:hypothetical protein
MKMKLTGAIFLLMVSAFSGAGVVARQDQDHPPLDLRAIPISDWLNGGEHADIPWNFRVRDPILRIDQRLEVSYTADIAAKDLNKTGNDHELFLISRVSSPDGEWLNEANIVRHTVESELPKNVQAEFQMRLCAQPGDYLLWAVLYDRKTGKHNVAKHRLHISEMRGDPLPDLYRRMPLVEFVELGDSDHGGVGFVNSQLYLPVRNKRPLQVELMSMLSPPEQWTGRTGIVRRHNDDTLGALAALSQIELTDGTISITGLDLVRRQVMFEQRDIRSVKWTSLMEAMKKAQIPGVSTKDLQGAKNNAAFFREILNQRLTSEPVEADPLRVIVVVTSSRLFESGSDLRPLQIEGDCHCRVYYLRFRLNVNDVFDELEKLMKPLHPRTFNLISARDLRKAIAEIVDELGKL